MTEVVDTLSERGASVMGDYWQYGIQHKVWLTRRGNLYVRYAQNIGDDRPLQTIGTFREVRVTPQVLRYMADFLEADHGRMTAENKPWPRPAHPDHMSDATDAITSVIEELEDAAAGSADAQTITRFLMDVAARCSEAARDAMIDGEEVAA